MQELTHLRGPRSKTWLLDDGVTHRLEIGGGIAHHQKNGAWVDTDITWHGLGTGFGSGEYPYQVRFNKGTHALTILLPGEVVPFTIAPIGRNKKAVTSFSANRITVPNQWTGVTLDVYLTPEGISIQYTKTATTYTNPAWTLPGDAAAFLVGGETYEGADGTHAAVPTTYANGRYTIDMSAVPVGVTVR